MFKRDIATIYELNALERMHTDPYAAYTLTPKGMEFSRAKYEMQRWQARRAEYLHSRLSIAGYKLRTEFERQR